MIRRLQPGYNGGVGALHSKEDNNNNNNQPKIRYCQRCLDMFQVLARLGPKVLLPDDPSPKPSDYNLWLECRNSGTVYPKHETKVEPALEPIKEPMNGPHGKIQGIEKKKKSKGRGYNPRLNKSKWEIKDEELNAELKSGAVLLAYSSNDPTEPII